jgi:hypothetical protein
MRLGLPCFGDAFVAAVDLAAFGAISGPPQAGHAQGGILPRRSVAKAMAERFQTFHKVLRVLFKHLFKQVWTVLAPA